MWRHFLLASMVLDDNPLSSMPRSLLTSRTCLKGDFVRRMIFMGTGLNHSSTTSELRHSG